MCQDQNKSLFKERKVYSGMLREKFYYYLKRYFILILFLLISISGWWKNN